MKNAALLARAGDQLAVAGERVYSARSMSDKLIPVLPKNYRSIAIHAIGVAAEPVVLMDRKRVQDFTTTGPVTPKGIRACIDFEVWDGRKPILGFHDHPDQMWVTESYHAVAEYCAAQGWLKIQGPAS